MTRPLPDWSVYLVTDTGLCAGRGVAETVRQAVRAGAGVVQVRDKEAGTRELIALVRAAREAMAGTDAVLLVNDRVDVALAAGADGVHVGQTDMPPAEARRLLGPGALIGLSVETMPQAREAANLDVDYLGVSPVFETPTKTDTAPAWGLDGLAGLRRATTMPLVGIGGIGAHNAAEVIRAGASGVAVVSAICAADDPWIATRDILSAVSGARD